jgi:hypothetical protein
MKIILFISLVFLASCGNPESEGCVDYPELEFFNTIGGVLQIELSKEPESMENLPGNLVSPKDSKLVTVKLVPEIFIEKTEKFRPLTDSELKSIAFNKPKIKLTSLSNEVVEHDAPNNKYFTVLDLLKAVESTEQKTRGNTDWFGGVDVHHIFFEGIYCENGKRMIYWGS